MAKFSISYDRVTVNPEFFSKAEIVKTATQEVADTIARTNAAMRAGQNADGTRFHNYSLPYIEAIQRAMRPLKKGKKRSPQQAYLRKKAGKLTPNHYVSGTLHQARRAFASTDGDGAVGLISPGRPGKVTNVQLARFLNALGRTEWHAFGKIDIDRINKRFQTEFANAAQKKLLKITKGR